MGRFVLWVYMISTVIAIFFSFDIGSAAETVLRKNYYAKSCPNVETVVRTAVKKKLDKGQFPTIPATLRLLFHDCFVEGCDASVLIQSTPSNTAEKDHPDNLSLAGDGFDAVGKAKEALEKDPKCRNKVSCADILALAARDVVFLSGGPYYEVELGRLDGLRSTATSVTGKLPQPNFDLDQLISIFSSNGLSMNDLIALSAAHTVGFAHCKHVANRIYNFSSAQKIDPTLNPSYAIDLQAMCPRDVDPIIAINMDPDTHKRFDNNYYKLLQQGKGLFSSDQVLYTDPRSRNKVNLWARNHTDFYLAFVTSITRLGRIGIKTGSQGNIRQNCFAFNEGSF